MEQEVIFHMKDLKQVLYTIELVEDKHVVVYYGKLPEGVSVINRNDKKKGYAALFTLSIQKGCLDSNNVEMLERFREDPMLFFEQVVTMKNEVGEDIL